MRRLIVTLALVGSAAVALPLAATPENPESPSIDHQQPAVAVQQVSVPLTGLRDEAAMVLVGTALIGLGAAVRRTA